MMTEPATRGIIESAVMMLMESNDFYSPQDLELNELLLQMTEEYHERGVDRAADALQDCATKMTPESNYDHFFDAKSVLFNHF